MTTNSTAQDDKVVYAAPVQAVTIPHQAVASGEQYAVSTKAINKTSEKHLSQEHVDAPDTTKDFQGVSANSYHTCNCTCMYIHMHVHQHGIRS